jgi:copper(I)-binding protein
MISKTSMIPWICFYAVMALIVICMPAEWAYGDSHSSDPEKGLSDSLIIEKAWSRETPPGTRSGVVYLDIRNAGDTTLILTKLESDIAGSTHLHESRLMDGMMKMHSVKSLSIDPGEVSSLQPSGLHIMLMGLKKPLLRGESHQLKLSFSNASSSRTVKKIVEVKILPISQLSYPD